MNARLALIGAPGAGKTTVGALVADTWGADFVDTDAEYERRYGHSVAEAVIDDEAAFRVAEEGLVLTALGADGAVVAVGSGAPMSPRVRAGLAAVPTVWLEVGLVAAARRTGLSGSRPVAMGNVRGQLHDMLQQRAEVYRSAAGHTLPTDDKDPGEIAEDVVRWEAGR